MFLKLIIGFLALFNLSGVSLDSDSFECLQIFAKPAYASEINIQEPTGYVSDLEGIIDDGEEQELEKKLSDFAQETGNEIVILTVNDFRGTYLEDFAVSVYDQWKINENGVLIIISAEQRKSRIEVGYGLEPILTDAETGRLQDNYMIPNFREGDYTAGVVQVSDVIIKRVSGEIDSIPQEVSQEGSLGLTWMKNLAVWILIIGFAFLQWLGSTKSWWLGGVLGVGAGLLIGLLFFRWWGVVIFPVGLGIFGLILDFILSKIGFGRNSRTGKAGLWHAVSSSNRSGSSSGFGGFSGSGGGSGGGGSSRSW